MSRAAATASLFFAQPAFAAQPGQVVGGSELASMLVSTLIVIGIIVAFGWLYSRSKLAVTGSRDVIQVVASRALGTKERLLLVEVADQQLLVGMTSTQLQTLHVFDKPVVEASQDTEQTPTGFAERLRSSVSEIVK